MADALDGLLRAMSTNDNGRRPSAAACVPPRMPQRPLANRGAFSANTNGTLGGGGGGGGGIMEPRQRMQSGGGLGVGAMGLGIGGAGYGGVNPSPYMPYDAAPAAVGGGVGGGFGRRRAPSAGRTAGIGGGGGGMAGGGMVGGGAPVRVPSARGGLSRDGVRALGREAMAEASRIGAAAAGGGGGGGYSGLAINGSSAAACLGGGGGAAAASVAGGPLAYGFAADQNARFRKYMEDEHTAVVDFAQRRGALYCGLYDGHGGRTAVEFVQSHLHASVERELLAASPTDAPLDALKRAFVKLDRMLLQVGALHCGTTAAVCLCLPSAAVGGGVELHVANVGDSRVVLAADGGRPARRLSVDHVGTDASEVRRVQEEGGTVVNGRVGGSLAVTRALGDHCLKTEHSPGVSPEPHVTRHAVAHGDRFVILASDGVWDVHSDEDAADLVLSYADAAGGGGGGGGGRAEALDDVANKLVASAIARGSRDNISALVIRLPR